MRRRENDFADCDINRAATQPRAGGGACPHTVEGVCSLNGVVGSGHSESFHTEDRKYLKARAAAQPRAGEGACPHTVEGVCSLNVVVGQQQSESIHTVEGVCSVKGAIGYSILNHPTLSSVWQCEGCC